MLYQKIEHLDCSRVKNIAERYLSCGAGEKKLERGGQKERQATRPMKK